MADDNNPGQFGNRSDTKKRAHEGGEASSGSSGSNASGAAGKTEAAKRGGKHSRGMRRNNS